MTFPSKPHQVYYSPQNAANSIIKSLSVEKIGRKSFKLSNYFRILQFKRRPKESISEMKRLHACANMKSAKMR